MVRLEQLDRITLLRILEGVAELSTERGRRQTLINAGLGSIARHLDLSGAPTVALGEIVAALSNYGRLTADTEALGVLLDWIKPAVGEEQQHTLSALITKYRMSTPAVAPVTLKGQVDVQEGLFRDRPPCEHQATMGKPLRVFISYSHKDAALKDKLLEQLNVLERFHGVDVWTDDQIKPGAKWHDEITKAMATSDVALLLVSAPFLASNFINDTEIPQLLKRNAAAGLVVIPVILSDCPWQHHPALEPFQALPKDTKSIAEHRNRAKAWKQVAEAIAALVKERNAPSY